MNHPTRSMIKKWPAYLKDFRSRHKLTQHNLADLLMVSSRCVENWEGEINTPPTFLKIALEKIALDLVNIK